MLAQYRRGRFASSATRVRPTSLRCRRSISIALTVPTLIDDIVDMFTELGDYLSMPAVRTYSRAMMIRLPWAATELPGDIFIVDELIERGRRFLHANARRRVRRRVTPKAKDHGPASHYKQ